MADETVEQQETTQTDEQVQETVATKETIRRKIDGRDREYTREEWDSAAERWIAGDNRLEEAKRWKDNATQELETTRAEAATAMQLKKHLDIVQDSTADLTERVAAYKAVAPSFGVTSEQVDQQIAQWRDGSNPQQTPKREARMDSDIVNAMTKREKEVNEVLQEMAQRVMGLEEENSVLREDHNKKREADAVEAVKELVRKDDELSRYLKAGDDKASAVYSLAVDSVSRNIHDGRIEPDDLQSALSQVRALLKKLDIRTTKAMPGIPGFGPGGLGSQGYDLEKEPDVKPGNLSNFIERMEVRRQRGESL